MQIRGGFRHFCGVLTVTDPVQPDYLQRAGFPKAKHKATTEPQTTYMSGMARNLH